MSTIEPAPLLPGHERRERRESARRRAQRRLLLQRAVVLLLLVGSGVLVVSILRGAGGSPLPGSGTAAARSGGTTAVAPPSPARTPAGAAGPSGRWAFLAAAPPTRRSARRQPAGSVPPALAKAVSWARTRAENDFHEVGTTNCSPSIARWERNMGLDVPAAPPCRPWCGAFIHEAFLQSGIDLSQRIIDPNSAYADAVHHERGLRRIPKRSVRPGDLVFFALDKAAVAAGAQASHVAIVIGAPRNGRVRTAEGNVGHHVVATRRGLRYVVLAARVTRKPARVRAAAAG